MSKEPLELNRTKDIKRWIPCSECARQTDHNVLVSVNISTTDPYTDVVYNEVYEVIQCQGCKTISFRKALWASDDISVNELGEYEAHESEELYPSRVTGRRKLRTSSHIPFKIVNIYKETYIALCNKSPVLTGMGIRALIEAVCTEKSAYGNNLEKQIDNLIKMGVLTEDGAEILHRLRYMGNKAAHEVKPHSDEELNIAFDVVEYLLEGVYLLPGDAKKLPSPTTS